MKLKSSLREKRRYLLLQVNEKERNKAEEKLDNLLLKTLSEFEYAKAGPIIIFTKIFDSKANILLSINVKSLKQIKELLASTKIKLLKVFGTIKKAKRLLN